MESSSVAQRPLVLIVEDNQDLAEAYELLLSMHGYRVATASNGRAGLESVRQLAPDVVVLDMMMPEVDGLEFLAQLPATSRPPPRVIANSGFEAFEERARALGAHAFLKKPVSRDQLIAAIEGAVAGREQAIDEPATSERIAAQRQQAGAARDRLWRHIDLDDPVLRRPIEGLAGWLPQYFGFGRGLVDLMCADRIYVYAGSDRAGKLVVDRSFAFCSDVIDAGSSLLIADARSHPVFSSHKAISFWGARFYAGCPIPIGSELVVGTVCLVDTRPRAFDIVDMHVLEHVARRVGALLEAHVDGRAPSSAPFFEPPALFDRETLEAVLALRLRERTDAELLVLDFDRDPAPLREAASVVHDAAGGLRVLAARHSPRALAILCDGPDPAATRALCIAALEHAALVPRRVGVAAYRSARFGTGEQVGADQLIAAAEAACARSAPPGIPAVDELTAAPRA